MCPQVKLNQMEKLNFRKTSFKKTASPPEGAHVLFRSLLVQVQEQTKEPRKNPFLRKKRAPLPELSLLRTVQQVPGVGKAKAPLLLQRFPSIRQLSNASVRELEPVAGQAAAQQIHAFFTQSGDSWP